MENFLPGIFRKHNHEEDPEEYGRHVYPRPGYAAVPMPYTGQPVGFEHLGSPPKQRLADMDPKTIAQLGYEGPEGERRKVEAINEAIYEREVDRSGYPQVPVRSDGYQYREGYSDSHGRHDNRHVYHQGHSGRSSSSHSSHYGGHGRRDDDSDEEYAGQDPRYRRSSRHGGTDRYGQPRPGYGPPIPPVHVERKVEEDGTVVERIYPDNTTAAAFARPDYGKIHYGRQDSFPETALQEAAAYAQARRAQYPGPGYPTERTYPGSGYAPPYSEATSSYVRRPYEGSSGDYVDEKYRRY